MLQYVRDADGGVSEITGNANKVCVCVCVCVYVHACMCVCVHTLLVYILVHAYMHAYMLVCLDRSTVLHEHTCYVEHMLVQYR